ncbi:hypothetical protein [Acinetobacter sp.]|uniref:hypothetical protein n=1 Tax=Acinetobacter sp. TaxID=472 RepID=UPI002FC9C422
MFLHLLNLFFKDEKQQKSFAALMMRPERALSTALKQSLRQSNGEIHAAFRAAPEG